MQPAIGPRGASPGAFVLPNRRPMLGCRQINQEPAMKRLILAAALVAAAGTASADQTYTPAPQAVLDATAGEATMDRVLPLTLLAGIAVFMVLAGNN